MSRYTKANRGYYFVWNGISSKEFGIGITSAPIRSLAERKVNTIEVPYRDGNLTVDTGAYGTFTVDFDCILVGDFTPQHIRKIKRWLAEPIGTLLISDELEMQYEAKMISKVDFTELVDNTGSFLVTFECQPYGHYRQGLFSITTGGTTEIHNETDLPAYPYIRVYGNGDINMHINNNPIILEEVVGYVEIDSVLMDCFCGSELLNHKMKGYFPVFQSGVNTIVSNATKLEIIPRWRAL